MLPAKQDSPICVLTGINRSSTEKGTGRLVGVSSVFLYTEATFYNIICIFARKLQKLKFKEKDYG